MGSDVGDGDGDGDGEEVGGGAVAGGDNVNCLVLDVDPWSLVTVSVTSCEPYELNSTGGGF